MFSIHEYQLSVLNTQMQSIHWESVFASEERQKQLRKNSEKVLKLQSEIIDQLLAIVPDEKTVLIEE